MPDFYTTEEQGDETVNPTTPPVLEQALAAPLSEVGPILAGSAIEGDDDISYVDKAADAMDALSDSPPVNNAVIQRYVKEQAPVAKTKGMESMYSNERADPKHRMGLILQKMYLPYMNFGQQTGKAYFEWLDSLSYFEVAKYMKDNQVFPTDEDIKTFAVAFAQGVKYMDKATRSRYRVWIGNNKIMFGAKPLDTIKLKYETVFSGMGWAIWVMSPLGDIYTCKHVKGLMQHSSLLAGTEVRGAGEWQVIDGVVKTISGKSGHYRCNLEYLIGCMTTMQANGIPLNTAEVLLWDPLNTRADATFVPVQTFLNMDPAERESRYAAMGTGAVPFTPVQAQPKFAGQMGAHRVKT